MIEIDGSFGEGGGQILRTSLTLSAITKKPFRIYNIRAKRPKPGLQRQHLTAVEAVKTLTNAKVKGDYVGSTELIFEPQDIVEGGNFTFNIGTAGSVTLVFQTILPLLLNRKIEVKLIGGTDVPKSPTIDYIRLVFLPLLQKIGISGEIIVNKRGHYPEGGGEVIVRNFRARPSSFSITNFGKLLKIVGISHVSSLPSHIAERQKSSAISKLSKLGVEISIDLDVRQNEISKGSGITLSAIGENSIIGADSLGERGKRAEVVGEEAAEALIKELKSGGATDSHMGDMLMLYASLYGGEYTSSFLTEHAKTNAEVIKKFLPVEIEISGNSPYLFKAKSRPYQ
mgnify:CR=1 FL=1